MRARWSARLAECSASCQAAWYGPFSGWMAQARQPLPSSLLQHSFSKCPTSPRVSHNKRLPRTPATAASRRCCLQPKMIAAPGPKGREIPIPGVVRVPTYGIDYLPVRRERNTYIRSKGGCTLAQSAYERPGCPCSRGRACLRWRGMRAARGGGLLSGRGTKPACCAHRLCRGGGLRQPDSRSWGFII